MTAALFEPAAQSNGSLHKKEQKKTILDERVYNGMEKQR